MLNSAQSSGPVIDEIFNALLAGDGASFDSLATDRAVECSEIRALICTDDSSAVALDLNLQLKSTIYVTSVFSGPRAVFVSPEISKQILSQGEKAIFPIDHSLSFDSNFAEKLRAMFNNENIPQFERDRVIAVLMLKANNPRVQLDVLPFLYENVRLACEDVDNLRPLNTLIAFRMLDHLNWEEFRHNPSQPDFGTDIKRLKDALQPSADAFLSGLYADQSVNHMEVTTLGTQALLFRFAKLWRNNPRKNTEQILEELIQFSITKLGALPSTELSLIWCGIKDKEMNPFFGSINNQSAKTPKAIRGMAWDMTHLRVMEQLANSGHDGTFFIPHFVSIDARWRQLLQLNPIKFMLADAKTKTTLFGRVNELDFQSILRKSIGKDVLTKFDAEKVAARRAAAVSLDRDEMLALVAEEERAFLQVI